MTTVVRLKIDFMGHKSGSVIELSSKLARRLIADGDAVEVTKDGPRPTRTKVAKAESVKG